MKVQDLQSQIALGEDSKRQFKVDVRNADSLAAEMAAFANTEGNLRTPTFCSMARPLGLAAFYGCPQNPPTAAEVNQATVTRDIEEYPLSDGANRRHSQAHGRRAARGDARPPDQQKSHLFQLHLIPDYEA